MKTKRSIFLSWPMIILLTVLLFPLGYFLIWKRVQKGVGGGKDGAALLLISLFLFAAFFTILIPALQGNLLNIDRISAPLVPLIMIGLVLLVGLPAVLVLITGFGCFGRIGAGGPSVYEMADDIFSYAAEELRRQREMQRQAASAVPNDTSVKCPHCGAYNRIFRNRHNVCEYCDTPLEWPDDL